MFVTVDIGATHVRVAGFRTPEPNSLITMCKVTSPQEYTELYSNLGTAIKSIANSEKIDAISIGSTGLVAPDHKTLLRCAF
jgi:predicted NBD/HSP70 family sugar kinase